MVWTEPLRLTLELMAVAVAIAAIIGIVGAWAASSLETSGRLVSRVLSRIFLAAMLTAVAMPMILHAAAWEATAGKFGWWMLTQTGARSGGSALTGPTGVYGFFSGLVACGWVHGLFGGAMVALATWQGVRRIPGTILEQSRMDAGPIAVWWRVRLPIASPWLLAGLLGTAALAATEMTVVDLYGYRTLADRFYLYHAIDPSWQALAMTCFLPLAMLGGLLTWALVSRRRLLATSNTIVPSTAMIDRLPRSWELAAALLATGIAAVVIVVPLGGLIVKAGHEVVVSQGVVSATWSLHACLDRVLAAPQMFAEEYRWTAILAVLSGGSAVVLAWPVAAIARTHRRFETTADMVTIAMIAVPGPIVGLAVVSFFQLDFPGFRTLYQQTLLPTTIALLFRAGPTAYWVLRAGYRGIQTVVLDTARLDTTPLGRLWSVDRPLLQRHLIAACLAAAVVASGDVPVMLPVLPAGVTTVGVRLFGLLHSGARYQEASLAIWYVAAILVIAMIWLRQRIATRVKLN